MENLSKVYFWKVKCINRGTREMFDRNLVLDPRETAVPTTDLAEIHRLAAERHARMELAKYRHYFREAALPEIHERLKTADTFQTIWIHHYYEDEAGAQLSKHDFFDTLAGQKGTVLLGEPDSVVRVGPTDIANPQDWTVEKANDIAHFLEVITFLSHSEWVKTPTSYGAGGFKCPSVYVMNSVLVFLRQLFSNDDLFGRAVEVYAAHCSHETKRFWVLDRKAAFDKLLNDEPFPRLVQGISSRELINLFLYGFGLIHWGDENRDRRKQREFRDLIKDQGRDRVVFCFQSALQFLAGYSTEIAFPIAQDMSHWIKAQGHVGPDRVSLRELLG